MASPLVSLEFQLVQGDAWSYVFPVVYAASQAPFPLSGYSAAFRLRQNYGDSATLISIATGVNSANGSNVTLVAQAPSTILNAVFVVIRGADTLALPVMVGQKTTRFFGQLTVTPPGGDPITVATVTWYMRSIV
jgi:hypothetical protein